MVHLNYIVEDLRFEINIISFIINVNVYNFNVQLRTIHSRNRLPCVAVLRIVFSARIPSLSSSLFAGQTIFAHSSL